MDERYSVRIFERNVEHFHQVVRQEGFGSDAAFESARKLRQDLQGMTLEDMSKHTEGVVWEHAQEAVKLGDPVYAARRRRDFLHVKEARGVIIRDFKPALDGYIEAVETSGRWSEAAVKQAMVVEESPMIRRCP